MKVKDYLSQGIWLDRAIQNKLEQKERLEAMAQKVTVNLTQEKVTSGGNVVSPMEDATVKLIDLQHEINDAIDQLITLRKEILKTINQVSDASCQLLLEMRYINGRTWEEVARGLGFDKRWILRLHGKALKEIEQKMKYATKSH